LAIELRIQNDKGREANEQSLLEARKMVEDILLDFSYNNLPPIKNDGSAGRLMYEIAASFDGPHRYKESTSKAVKQRYPKEKSTCMSVLDLPCVIDEDGEKTFCTGYLLKDHLTKRIKRLKGRHLVCDRKGMDTRWCDSYILVYGDSFTIVDKTARLLKDEIRRHQDGCRCTPYSFTITSNNTNYYLLYL
jgi:hypothetical protein